MIYRVYNHLHQIIFIPLVINSVFWAFLNSNPFFQTIYELLPLFWIIQNFSYFLKISSELLYLSCDHQHSISLNDEYYTFYRIFHSHNWLQSIKNIHQVSYQYLNISFCRGILVSHKFIYKMFCPYAGHIIEKFFVSGIFWSACSRFW